MNCARCNTTIIRGQKMSLVMGQWVHTDPSMCTDNAVSEVVAPAIIRQQPKVVSARIRKAGVCTDCGVVGFDKTFWSTRFSAWICLDCDLERCHKTAIQNCRPSG